MKDYEIMSWDHKGQVDFEELNTHLLKFKKPQVYQVENDDNVTVIITEAGSTPEEVRAMFDDFTSNMFM